MTLPDLTNFILAITGLMIAIGALLHSKDAKTTATDTATKLDVALNGKSETEGSH